MLCMELEIIFGGEQLELLGPHVASQAFSVAPETQVYTLNKIINYFAM